MLQECNLCLSEGSVVTFLVRRRIRLTMLESVL
jgi:hypothetical protein